MPTVKATSDESWFKIYINDLIHLQLKRSEIIGFQSSIDGSGQGVIEFYTPTQKILCNYAEKTLWIDILKVLEKEFTELK